MHCLESNVGVLVVWVHAGYIEHVPLVTADKCPVRDLVKVSSGLQQSCLSIEAVYP